MLYRELATRQIEAWGRAGVAETWGSNAGPVVSAILRGVGLGPGQPWCQATVSEAFDLVGADFVIQTGLVSAYYNWAVGSSHAEAGRRGSWLPERGDQVCFEYDGWLSSGDILDHVGTVTKRVGNTIYTVEGNSGNRVAYRSYDINASRIYGYVRVLGDPTPVDPKAPGAPYVTKPYPLPQLVDRRKLRKPSRVKLGAEVIYEGSYWKCKKFYKQKLAYWQRKNLSRR